MIIDEKEIKEAQDWIKIQLENIHPDTSGMLILRYGTEDYMVSGNTAKKLLDRIKGAINEKFPKLLLIMLPFWIKAETIKDLEEFMNE